MYCNVMYWLSVCFAFAFGKTKAQVFICLKQTESIGFHLLFLRNIMTKEQAYIYTVAKRAIQGKADAKKALELIFQKVAETAGR